MEVFLHVVVFGLVQVGVEVVLDDIAAFAQVGVVTNCEAHAVAEVLHAVLRGFGGAALPCRLAVACGAGCLDELQDVEHTDFLLPDQLGQEGYAIKQVNCGRLFFAFAGFAVGAVLRFFLFAAQFAGFFVDVVVDTGVALHVVVADEFVAAVADELVVHAQFLLQFKHLVHQLDVAGLVFGGVHGDGAALVDGEFFAQFRYGLVVCGVGFLVGSGERDVEGGLAAAVFGVAEEGEGVLGCLFEVAEAHDVAGGLERVEDSVGAAVCLYQAVHFQVFVYPEGVDGLGVEAGEEHVHDNEQVQLTHLHLAGDVLVVVVEGVAVGAEVGAEHGVVVFEVAVHAAAGAFGGEGEVFFFAEGVEELPAVALRVDDGDLELLFGAQGAVCDAFFLQGVEGVVVGAGSINRRGCQD